MQPRACEPTYMVHSPRSRTDRQTGRQTRLQFDFGEVLWGSLSHTHTPTCDNGSGDDDARSTWSSLLLVYVLVR